MERVGVPELSVNENIYFATSLFWEVSVHGPAEFEAHVSCPIASQVSLITILRKHWIVAMALLFLNRM